MNPPPLLQRPHRTPAQRTENRAAVRRQVAQLERRDPARERRILDRLVGARNARPGGVRIDRLETRQRAVLAAQGEVLVRSTDATAQQRRDGEEVAGLQDRVLRLRGIGPGQRGGDRRLRPNYVVPMGIVMKTLCGPEEGIGSMFERPAVAGQAIPIAVIDTGIAAAQRTDGWLTAVENANNVDRRFPEPPTGFLALGAGHGTFVAGIIQQFAPTADIRAYRALEADGLGTEVQVAQAMMQAVRDGAKIVNLSLGIETLDDDADPPIALEAAVELITGQFPDVLIVAAAGNGGADRPCWPGAFADVQSVAGLTADMARTDWSTRGDWVDFSTRGEGVLSTYVPGAEDPAIDLGQSETFNPPNPWAVWTGTSFAAPQLTGAVAQLAQTNDITPRAALELVRQEGSPIPKFGLAIELLEPET